MFNIGHSGFIETEISRIIGIVETEWLEINLSDGIDPYPIFRSPINEMVKKGM